MKLPFSTAQFLEVFEKYNLYVWPMQVALFVLALYTIFLFTRYTPKVKVISLLLAFLWVWMGTVYHMMFFSAINKLAYLFGWVFIFQGLLLVYFGIIKNSLHFRFRADLYGLTGLVLMLYALVVYPLISYRLGHLYPAAPTFGLPCPTVIFTLATLLWVDKKYSLSIAIIPVLWSVVGFTAALSLGFAEDYGLLVAGVVTAVLIVIRHRKWKKMATNIAYA